MLKTATINVRIDPTVKNNAQELFASLGLSVTDAIQIFLHKSLLVGGLPFDVRHPQYNAEAEEVMQEARDIISGKTHAKTYSNVEEALQEHLS